MVSMTRANYSGKIISFVTIIATILCCINPLHAVFFQMDSSILGFGLIQLCKQSNFYDNSKQIVSDQTAHEQSDLKPFCLRYAYHVCRHLFRDLIG